MLRQTPTRPRIPVVPAARSAVSANLRRDLPATVRTRVAKESPSLRKRTSRKETNPRAKKHRDRESILSKARGLVQEEKIKMEAKEKQAKQKMKEEPRQEQKQKEEKFQEEQRSRKGNIGSFIKSGEEWLSSKEKATNEILVAQQQRHPLLIGLLLTALVALIFEKSLEKAVFDDSKLEELEKRNRALTVLNTDLMGLVVSYKRDITETKELTEKTKQTAEALLAEQAKQVEQLQRELKYKDEIIANLEKRIAHPGTKQISFGRYSLYHQEEKNAEEVKEEKKVPEKTHTTSPK